MFPSKMTFYSTASSLAYLCLFLIPFSGLFTNYASAAMSSSRLGGNIWFSDAKFSFDKKIALEMNRFFLIIGDSTYKKQRMKEILLRSNSLDDKYCDIFSSHDLAKSVSLFVNHNYKDDIKHNAGKLKFVIIDGLDKVNDNNVKNINFVYSYSDFHSATKNVMFFLFWETSTSEISIINNSLGDEREIRLWWEDKISKLFDHKDRQVVGASVTGRITDIRIQSQNSIDNICSSKDLEELDSESNFCNLDINSLPNVYSSSILNKILG